MTTALEDGRIQIEAIALLGHQEEWQDRAPERSPEGFDSPLGEAGKEVADGIGARKTSDAKHGVKRLVRSQPVAMSKTACSNNHRTQEGC